VIQELDFYLLDHLIKLDHMKRIFIVLNIFFNLSYCYCQTFETDWLQCYGTTGYDQGYDVIKTMSGYYLLGVTEQKDIWLCKTDQEGDLVWDKKYGGSKSDGAVRLLKRNDNNYYIIGDTDSSDGDITYDPYPNSSDIFVLSIDSLGNILWDKIYGGSARDLASNATIKEDGSIIIAGVTTSCDGDVSNCYGFYDFWILKIDNTGQKVWDLVIGSSTQDWSTIIINTSDGGSLTGGWTGQPFYPGGNITCLPYGIFTDMLLVKIDSTGNIEWQQCYGGSNDEGISDIISVENGYMLLCMTNSGDGDVADAGYHLGYVNSGTQTFDMWVINVDFQGNYLWSKCYGGSSMEVNGRIFKTSKGFRIFCEAESFDGDVQGNHSWNDDWSDIWTFEIDSVGNLLSNQSFGSFSYERINYGVQQINDYEYTIAGSTQSYDWLCSGEIDIILMNIHDTLGTGLEDYYLNDKVLVYPNPAYEYITFENKEPLPMMLKIFDVLGKRQRQIIIQNGKNTISVTDYLPGIHFYQYFRSNNIVSGKFLIAK